jgi:hypothetical protein
MNGGGEYAAYRYDAGQLQLTPSCLLFFDILGTSEMSVASDAVDHLRRLRPALEAAIERAGTDDRVFDQASTWFTDNAVVATPLTNTTHSEVITGGMQVSAAYLLLVCWERGFLGRGAITVGPHYMDERFVFGPALIEAVALEKGARWPRVVLGHDAVAVERAHSRFYATPLRSTQSQCLCIDEDEVVFVDPLGIYIDEEHDENALDHFLDRHKRATVTALARYERSSEPWEKWRWLGEYQNHALLSRLRDPEPYLVPLDEQRHEFRDFLDDGPYTSPGSAWYALDRHNRVRASEPFGLDVLPDEPGVYAFYRGGARQYVGATKSLSRRIRDEHMSQSPSIGNSALRRNLAQLLGIANAAAMRQAGARLGQSDVVRLAHWLRDCEIGWQEAQTEQDASSLARQLKREYLPPLNRK